MKLALSWLKDYTKYNLPTDKLVERLIMTTAEVEQVIDAPISVQEATVAKILEIKKHPNADRLSLVRVNTAKGEHTVVCGAKNIKQGDKVPFIAAGCHYQNNDNHPEILTKAKIRGVLSNGMLASEKDLGVSGKHEGIMLLDQQAKVGQRLSNYLDWDEPVLDLEITPNRGDLQSYVGLSREIAVIAKSRLNTPTVSGYTIEPKDSAPQIITTVNTEDCNRYITIVVDEIANTTSPRWLKNRLLLNDIEPINAVVDITNFVMLETGQPMHAFDWAKLSHPAKGIPTINVRKASKGETISTLDGTVIKLSTGDTVIANEIPVAIAGIIGGESTKVDLETEKIVLEAAIFEASSTRKAARRHNIRTESLVRFEKGVDEEQTMVAVKRALSLLKDITGGKPVGRLSDINNLHPKKERINVSLDRAERVLGTNIDRIKIKTYLSSIGFQVSTVSQNRISVLVPSWRKDVAIEEDIYEEISRMHGYDKIESTLPSGTFNPSDIDNSYQWQKRFRTSLVKLGYKDIVTQAFISATNAEKYQPDLSKLVEISNPTSINEQYLRPLITPALIERASVQSRQVQSLSSFEIGNVFIKKGSSYQERTAIGICVLCDDYTEAARAIKAALTQTIASLEQSINISYATNKECKYPYLSPNTEQIKLNNKSVGEIGVLMPSIKAQNRIRGERYAVVAEMDITDYISLPTKPLPFTGLKLYPEVVRDLSITIESDTTIGELIDRVNNSKLDLLDNVEVTDIYQDNNKQSITIRIHLYSDTHTLNEQEITDSIHKIETILKK